MLLSVCNALVYDFLFGQRQVMLQNLLTNFCLMRSSSELGGQGVMGSDVTMRF